MSSEKDNFRAFDSTKVTTLGDDLFRISSKIPFFMFSILMEGISVVFFTIVFFLWAIEPDTWVLDELCVFASFSVFFFGLVLLVSLLKFFKPFMKISDRIRPIRLKVKLEMFPADRKNVLEDLLSRLDDIFYLRIRDPGKYVQPEGDGFDIYYESKQSSLIYLFTFLMLLVLLASIFIEAILYSHFESTITLALLLVLELIVLSIFMIVVLRFFYRKEIILVKEYTKKVSKQDIQEMLELCEGSIGGLHTPLVLVALSRKGFSEQAVSFASRSRVKGEHPITLVSLSNNRFKVIWTG